MTKAISRTIIITASVAAASAHSVEYFDRDALLASSSVFTDGSVL